MDPTRVEAYLRSACSTLGFDLGELWCARYADGKTSLKFVQLYTSPTYEEFRGLLFPYDTEQSNAQLDSDKHHFSPLVCRAVCDTCQLVWANTRSLDGLIGRSDVPLNTAVGVPVCSVGRDLCVMVFFSVQPIAMTDESIRFLRSIVRAASGVSSGFLSVSSSTPVVPMRKNVASSGVWNGQELLNKYADTVDFKMVDIDCSHPEILIGAGCESLATTLDAKAGYRQNQTRYHEFMVAILGMTIFDAAELWLLSDRVPELYIVAALHRDGLMQSWTDISKDVRLKPGDDVPGKALEKSHHFWDSSYDAHGDVMTSRSQLASQLGIKTAFAVPLPGHRGVCGVLALYSKRDVKEDAFTVSLVNESIKLMSTIASDSDALSGLEIENIANFCSQTQLLDWFIDGGLEDWDRPSAATMSATGTMPSALHPHGEFPMGLPLDCMDMDMSMTMKDVASMYTPSPFDKPDFPMGNDGFSGDLFIPNGLPFTQFAYNSNCGMSMMPPLAEDPLATLFDFATEVQGAFLDDHDTRPTKVARISEDVKSVPKTTAAAASAPASYVPPPFSFPLPAVTETKPLASSAKRKEPTAPPAVTAAAAAVEKSKKEAAKTCRIDGCGAPSSSRSAFCTTHAGLRRCQFDGCTKCAQGSTCFCIAHGGGRRCTFAGCSKGARDKYFCAGHGGGKRCLISDCSKSAVGGSQYCTGHGGGKRCQVSGCNKSSQSSTNFCVRHGGGRKCSIQDCTKVARGKTDFCASHGGGIRCRVDHCNKAAIARYQLCRPHYAAATGVEASGNDSDDDDDESVDNAFVSESSSSLPLLCQPISIA